MIKVRHCPAPCIMSQAHSFLHLVGDITKPPSLTHIHQHAAHTNTTSPRYIHIPRPTYRHTRLILYILYQHRPPQWQSARRGNDFPTTSSSSSSSARQSGAPTSGPLSTTTLASTRAWRSSSPTYCACATSCASNCPHLRLPSEAS